MLQISRSSSWHARYTVLTYLQIMVFYNLFTFLSDAKAVSDVRALVLRLLEDEQLEVRAYTRFQYTRVARYTPLLEFIFQHLHNHLCAQLLVVWL